MPKILVALLTLLALAGCSSSPEKAPAEEAADKSSLPEFDAQADIRIRWRTQLGDGSGSNYIRLQPAVQNDTLYAADTSGRVTAMTLADGDELWSVELGVPVLSGVSLAGEQLFVATRDGFLLSLNRTDGRELWRSRLTSEAL